MNWMINIFFLVILTSLTGLLMQLVWLAGAKLFGHKNPVATYTGLRFVCLSYVIPIVYVLVWLNFDSSFYATNDKDYSHIMRKVLPFATPTIQKVVFYISLLWFIAFLLILFRHICQYIKRRQFQKASYQERDTKVLERLEECQKRLSIKRMPKLYRNAKLTVPLCTGLFSKAIMLPEKEYSSEQLEVIFMHELTHIKYHDLEFKLLSMAIVMIHSFNIPAHLLLKQISTWGEIKCDILTCREGREVFNTKKYYGVILNMMVDKDDKKKKDFFITALAEKNSDITKRMKYMKQYKDTEKGVQRAMTGVITAAFMASSTVSFAAGTMSLNYYDKFANENFAVKYESIEELGEEILIVDKTWNLVDITKDTNTEENMHMYQWNLDSMDTYVIQELYFQKGNSIKIYCNLNESSENIIMAGIIGSDNIARSVKNKSNVVHTFEIQEDGYYSIFVRNVNTSAIDVNFSCFLL